MRITRAPKPNAQPSMAAIHKGPRGNSTFVLGILSLAMMVISAIWRDLGFMLLALLVASFVALYFVFYSRSRARVAIGIVMLGTALVGIGLAFAVIATALVMTLLPVATDSVENIAIMLQTIIAYCMLVLGW